MKEPEKDGREGTREAGREPQSEYGRDEAGEIPPQTYGPDAWDTAHLGGMDESAVVLRKEKPDVSEQSALLWGLCGKERVEAFRDSESGLTMVRFPRNGRMTIDDLASGNFSSWLAGTLKEKEGIAPGDTTIGAVLRLFENAAHNAPKRTTFTRLARADDRVYIDLCTDERNAVEIDANGWRVVDSERVPVCFRRSGTMLPLPLPKSGGDLGELRDFINAKDDNSFILIVSWLVAATNPEGPFPILLLSSEHGSGKSSAGRFLKLLLDPDQVPKLGVPERDALFNTAVHHLVLNYDNLSDVKEELSDQLCRLSTGGGISKRKLYRNSEEFAFTAKRPVSMNGIGLSFTRPDLLSRTFAAELKPIPKAKQKTEREMDAAFSEAHPRLLGAICDAVSAALRERDYRPGNLPRMADAACWIMRAERGGGLPWTEGRFRIALEAGELEARESAIAEDPIARRLLELGKQEGGWCGSLKDLLRETTPFPVRGGARRGHTERALSQRLERLKPLLRSFGVEIGKQKRNTGVWISLSTAMSDDGDDALFPSSPRKP